MDLLGLPPEIKRALKQLARQQGNEAVAEMLTNLAEIADLEPDTEPPPSRAPIRKPAASKPGSSRRRTTDNQAQKELLLDLLDLRDRLQAGHDQAVRFRPGRLGGHSAVRFVASMAEGMAMNLRWLDETLARRGVRPLAVLGQPFDPHTMHVAELSDDPTQARGLVVGELRKGFHYQDQLLRSAEVVVNRPEGK